MRFLTPIDLTKNEILNFRFQSLASAPPAPVAGLAYYNSVDNVAYIYNGTTWLSTSAAGGTVVWTDITSKPTTIVGFGITDAFDGVYASLTGKPTLFDGVFASLTSKPTTLTGYGITDAVNTSLLGANSGVATLDAGGKVSTGQLPSITISDTFVVATQVAMLALAADVGDVAVRTDLNKSFILKTADATVLANWQELLTPTSAVTSVNTQTGAVVLDLFSGAYGDLTGAPNLALKADVTYVDSEIAGIVGGLRYSTNVGDAVALSYVITHNLNTRDVTVGIREASTPWAAVVADVKMTTVNTITLEFAVAPTIDQFRVTVIA